MDVGFDLLLLASSPALLRIDRSFGWSLSEIDDGLLLADPCLMAAASRTDGRSATHLGHSCSADPMAAIGGIFEFQKPANPVLY